MKLWAGRFQKETDTLVNYFNSSIEFDARLYRQDIAGSIAHAEMLGRTGIIEAHEAETIVNGLKAILADIEAGGVELLIHVGVDTVDMNGDGFKSHVQVGQAVKKGGILHA